jgi:hypothetical protein
MKRKNEFDLNKIYEVSTSKQVISAYLDSFGIEKVHFKAFEYETKKNIDIYVDFATISLIANDIASGRLFKMVQDKGYQIVINGVPKSKNRDGKPESRKMYVASYKNKLYVNTSIGNGKVTETGAIIPDGEPDTKISVGMDYENFCRLFLYTHDVVRAYLPKMVIDMVKNAETNRENSK